jgi:hypothetical protein
MEKESKFFQMVINLKANIKMDVQTVKENISGLMEAIMRDNSKMVIDKA